MSGKSNRGISTVYAAVGMIALLIVGFVAGYFIHTCPTESREFPEDIAWRTASIDLAGSTTVEPVAFGCAQAFMNKYNETTVTVVGGGSGVGYSNVIDGLIDIGMASRPPKPEEINNDQGVELWLHPIALDAVCVVVNPSVASSLSLTLEEVAGIYTGIYDSWDDLEIPGLPTEPIYVVIRGEAGSGTRLTFEEYTIEEYGGTLTYDEAATGNPGVKTAVETTPYSIGYIGLGFLSENMVAVALGETKGGPYFHPTIESIASGDYPISRYLYFVTSSQLPSGSLADRFIDFVLSPEGQQIAVDQGFLELPATYNYP